MRAPEAPRRSTARPQSPLVAAAERLSVRGASVALLHGDGWGETVLGLAPREQIAIPIGDGALTDASAAVGRLAATASTDEWLGYFAYEGARDLERRRGDRSAIDRDPRPLPIGAALCLRRYGAVAVDRAGSITISSSDRAAHAALEGAIGAPSVALDERAVRLRPVDDDAVHEARVRVALEAIARGDLYQVCLARRFVGEVRGPVAALHRHARATEQPRFGAWLDFGDHQIVCASPERFLEVGADRSVRTSPIKGTRARHDDPDRDAALARTLDDDPKERAELAMVVDLERNDLGRVCVAGSIRTEKQPRIESTPTVHHRVHDVVGTLREGSDLGALLAATLPSGSVTGAPKVAAMEAIATLERDRRGIYCGAIVRLRPGHATPLVAAMAIRTLVAARSGADAWSLVYDAGGGIVADSDPAREAEETRWKARVWIGAGAR